MFRFGTMFERVHSSGNRASSAAGDPSSSPRPRDGFRPKRRIVAIAAALVVLLTTAVATISPSAAQTPSEPKPPAAVAVGDSFISGEGAGDYLAVGDFGSSGGTFPGWTADNAHAYFCHRSANASIEVAALAGIDARFNISCSGGITRDMVNPSYTRDRGRNVEAQLDQLRDIATTHDIDLVLFGLGANDVGFTSAAQACVSGFLTDAYTGWWEGWINIWDPHATTRGACNSSNFPSRADVSRTTDDMTQALQDLVTTLEEIDTDGEHRIVIQNYVNPMPERFAAEYRSQNGRDDKRDKFRALARERYAAGCPIHESALPLAQSMTETLGDMVAEAQHRVLLNNPGADIVYLDVIDAFNGSHLCEQSNSPNGAFHTPVRALTSSGVPITSLSGKNKLDLQDMFDECDAHFQLCQESLHPNAAGHALLGQCLAGAWTANRPVVWCNGSGGRVSPIERGPRIDPNLSMRVSEGLDRNGNAVLVVDATWWAELFDAPGRTVQSTSVRINTGTTTLGTGSSNSGALSANVRCTGSSTTIYGSVTVTLDDGTRVNGSGSVRATCPGQPGGGGPIDQPKR